MHIAIKKHFVAIDCINYGLEEWSFGEQWIGNSEEYIEIFTGWTHNSSDSYAR